MNKPYRKPAAMRGRPHQTYILGVPERMIMRAMDEIDWRLVTHDINDETLRLFVRRPNTVAPVYFIDLPKDMKRRHVLATILVQLRLKGA